MQLYRLTFWTRHSAKIRIELEDEKNNQLTAEEPVDGNNSMVGSMVGAIDGNTPTGSSTSNEAGIDEQAVRY